MSLLNLLPPPVISQETTQPSASAEVWAERYLTERILGVGGMGVVYKAKDLLRESLGDPAPWVALKTLNRELREHQGADALLFGEFRLASQLRHSNIVSHLHFDVCSQHQHGFFTLEWIAGVTLEERLRQASIMPPALRLKWACQLVAALQHCHEHGVVHADLKPANLLLDQHQDLLLFDFGIGRLMAGGDAQFRLNRTDLDAWSYRYGAPELFHGALPSTTTDLFSLCCVIYQLLTLRHPFGQVTTDTLVSLSSLPTSASRHRRLNALLINGLSVLPERRTVSLAELAEGLAALNRSPAKWLHA